MLNICYKQKLITQQFVHTGLQKNYKKELILKKNCEKMMMKRTRLMLLLVSLQKKKSFDAAKRKMLVKFSLKLVILFIHLLYKLL